jgi:hypothetical protein
MLIQRRLAMEILALFCLGLVVHLAVLRWVFPGFLDPLWPNHDDLYIPIELASRSLTPLDYLRDWPRPIGFFFFGSIGYLGVQGALAVVVGLVVLNCALAAAFFRRVADIDLRWPFVVGFIAYVFLLFSEPHFYIVYRNDVFMHCSFFVMLCGTWIFWRVDARSPYVAVAVAFIAALAAFLCKETYGLTALGLGLVWMLLKIRERGFWLAAAPGAATALGLVLALLTDRLKNSPFTAGTGAYERDLHPLSILHEVLLYAQGALNPLTIALLAVAGWLAFRSFDRRGLWLAVPICVGLAVLAWVPIALIPAHYSAGYSWSGAYILFMPVLLIGGLRRPGIEGVASVAVILVAAALSPLLFLDRYRLPENLWTVSLETEQKNQLNSLTNLEAVSSETKAGAQRILVTGITSIFTPFHRPPALRWMYPKFDNIKFDFVYYSDPSRESNDGVEFIPTGSVRPGRYAAIWVFNRDGTLRSDAPPPADPGEPYVPDIGLTAGDILIYPELADIFPHRLSDQGSDRATAMQYFKCGTLSLNYQNAALAEKCMSRAIELQPKNPYAFYFRGMAQEKLGKFDQARASYAEAVAQDPSPVFRQALARFDAAAAAPKS